MSFARAVLARRLLPPWAVTAVAAACAAPRPSGWHDGAPLPAPRFEAPAVAMDGRIYFVGGISGITGRMETAQPSVEVDIFTPSTGQWSRAADLPAEAPKHHLAVAVLDHKLFLLGGFDGIIGRGIPTDAFRPSATTWVLDSDRWRRLADQPIARGGATAQAIAGRIYVAGGAPDESAPSYGDLYAYDPAMDSWTARAAMPTPREHVASCAIDGQMIVAGGWSGAMRSAQQAAERYDPATDRWTALPPMPTARGGLGGGVLGARCHFVGGEDWALSLPGTYALDQVLDPVTGQWTAAPPMALARHGAGVTVLDGQLWVVGGGPQQGNSYTDRVEVYTP